MYDWCEWKLEIMCKVLVVTEYKWINLCPKSLLSCEKKTIDLKLFLLWIKNKWKEKELV